MKIALAFACAITLHASAVHAQTVYRCGPDGRSYSQAPCAQGVAVDVSDTRTPDQRTAAATVAEEEKARGDRMAREREQQQKAIKPAQAGVIGHAVKADVPAPSAKPKSKKKKRGVKAEPTDFRSVAPAPPKKKNA